MKLAFYSETHVGLVRKENQDTILVNGDKGLFIVADGMGGHQGGAEASRMAVDTISTYLTKKTRRPKGEEWEKEDIIKAVAEANRAIFQKGRTNIALRGMGTTLCLFYIKKNRQAYIFNIGDSRLYMSKNDQFWLLTEDHNFLTHQLKACLLTGEKPPEPSADDETLTKSVGFFATVEPDIFEKTVEKGEKYLICSDGLSGFVPDKEIHHILQNSTGQEAIKQCIQKALSAGGADNVSAIMVEIQQ